MIPKLALDSIVKTVKPLGSAVFFPTLSGEVWMSLRQLIKYALSLPPRQAAGKGWRLARRLLAVRAWLEVRVGQDAVRGVVGR